MIPFEGFGLCDCLNLREINLQYTNLDGKMFTESLEGCTNIESITLNHINLINHDFRRVYLPKLIQFTFDRSIGFQEQYREYINYTTLSNLLSMLFFDVTTNFSKETELADRLADHILNSKVNTLIRVDGWTVVSWQNENELILALKYANEILKFAKMQSNTEKILSLTLTECEISITLIPKNLRYLNLYNVKVVDGNVMEMLNRTRQLQYLFVESPGTIIILRDLPVTLTEISFSSIDLIYNEGDALLNVSNVIFGSISNQRIFENFHTLFPNVESVAIFEPGDIEQHVLLLNIMRSGATWIYVSSFARKNHTEENISLLTQAEQYIERYLDKLKFLPDDTNFLLEKRKEIWTGRNTSQTQLFKFRYKLLGWKKYITTESYKEI